MNLLVATYVQQPASGGVVVTSANPTSGVPVTVSPADMAGRIFGPTPTSFLYQRPTTVQVTVPAVFGGAPFRQWLMNGAAAGSSPTIYVDAGSFPSLAAEYTRLVNGALLSFGNGCRGSNGRPLTQTATGNPVLYGSIVYGLLDALPTTPTILMVGTSNQRLSQLPLPFEGTPLGAPGCWLYCDHVVMLVGRSDANGSQTAYAAVPGDPSLIGSRLFTQFFAVDAASNAAGLTSSNAVETQIGGYQ